MRVAFLGPLPSTGAIGGVATHTDAVVPLLRARGLDVRVFDDAHIAGSAPPDAIGVRGAPAPVLARRALSNPGAALGRPGDGALASITALGIPWRQAFSRTLLLAEATRAYQPELVHVQQADFRPLYADAAGITAPRIITVHGLGSLATLEYPGLAEVIPGNLKAARAVTVPSCALAREVEELGVESSRITVIPNGVDHSVFSPADRNEAREALGLSPDRPLVVYAGRVTQAKGAGDLSRAWPLVLESVADAQLAFVGPLGDADLDPTPEALTPGPAGPEAIARWFAAADVVAVPSRYEGFGLSALEAMACARRVVAAEVGGLAEIVPPAAGKLVPAGDGEALVSALVEMLESGPEDRASAESAALAASAPYTWEAAAEGFAALYETVLEREPDRR